MYWDSVAKFYDLFEGIANRKVYEETGVRVAEEIESDDVVLECACGTGAISKYIAPKCRYLTATDFSEKMLRQTDKKLLEKSGAGFKQQFDLESYKAFFKEGGYEDVSVDLVEGKMPCAVAVIKK